MADSGQNSWWDILWMIPSNPLRAAVIAGWSTWFEGLVGFLGGATASLFWTLIGRHLLCWFEWYFCWVLRLVFASTLPAVAAVLSYIPALPGIVIDPMLNSWLIFNYWAPLNETIAGICVIFFVIWIFRWARFIKMFIPTASN